MKERIQFIMRQYNLTATQFATKIGIQRSALSHIMSGRNRPSLDFILKVKKGFPEISSDWLLLGSGKMIEQSNEKTSIEPELTFDQTGSSPSEVRSEEPATYGSPPPLENKIKKKSSPQESNEDSEIEKIIFFYNDGSFRTYKPQ